MNGTIKAKSHSKTLMAKKGNFNRNEKKNINPFIFGKDDSFDNISNNNVNNSLKNLFNEEFKLKSIFNNIKNSNNSHMFNNLENNTIEKIYNCNDNNREIKHSNFINLKENEKFQINNIKNSLENSNNSNNIIQNSIKNNEIDNTNLKKSSIKENNSKNKNDNKMKEINQIKANDFSKSEIIINNESKISVSKESQYDYAIVNKNEDNSDIPNKYNDWNIINIKKRKFNFKDNIANFHNNVFNIKNENENKINYQLTNENLINKLFDLELKILYNGTLNEFPKLKFPITIDFSSLILNSDSLLSDIRKNIKPNDLSIIVDLGMILKEIRNYIISIEEIENNIVLPKDEDIILEINGAKYINSLFANIEIDEINRQINKNNDSFFNIYYSFEIKQYPLITFIHFVRKCCIKQIII